MGMLLLLLVNIIQLTFIINSVSCVQICSNDTQIGQQVIFSRPSGIPRRVESCGCSLKLFNGDRNSTVTFQAVHNPQGCQYKLMFNLKTETKEYNCRNYGTTYQFTLSPTDQLYINLMNDQNGNSGFEFYFTIQTDGQRLNLTCRSPWTNPQVTTKTATATVGNIVKYDSTTGATRQTESTETTDISQITEEPQNSDLPVIVGCTVGGVVLVSVIVIIIICFLKRRKEKKHQTVQNVSDQNIRSITEHQNTVGINKYSDYDHIPSSSSQTEQQITDRNRYSDDYDHIPDSSSQTENKKTVDVVKLSNNNPYALANDLDMSKQEKNDPENNRHVSEQLEHVPGQLERVPNTGTEYAAVKKKPKKGVSQDKGAELNNKPKTTILHEDYENLRKDDLNLKMEINRIVGPKGDDYTLVNKF